METKELYEDLFVIDSDMVRAFLIRGKDEALLIDALFEKDHILDEIKKITNKPLKLVLTHGDKDHSEGGIYFKECFLHEKDFELLDPRIRKYPLKEGDVLKVGTYEFTVLEIPGHTRGSIAFFDKEKGLLISGDSIQKEGPIFIFGEHRDLDAYIKSQEKLLKIKDKIKVILPSHHDYPIDNSYIEKNLLDAIALKEGKLKGEKTTAMPCLTYQGEKGTKFYY